MEKNDLLRLRAYLDQEEAAIAKIWRETPEDVKKDFLDWCASDIDEKYKLTQSGYKTDMAWIDFASRLALWSIQSSVLRLQ